MTVSTQVEIHLATHVCGSLKNYTEHALDQIITLVQNGRPKDASVLLLADPVSCIVFEEFFCGGGSESLNLRGRFLLNFAPKSRLDELCRINTEVVLE